MEAYSESSDSTMREQFRWRKTRNQDQPILARTSTANPTSTIPSLMQSTRCKPALSSLILSTFSNNSHDKSSNNKKSMIKGTSLLGLGCTAGQEVIVPGVIREEAENRKKRNLIKQKRKKLKNVMEIMDNSKGMSVGVNDLWCGADTTSVDCVRPRSCSRGKIDLDRLLPRELLMFQNDLLVGRRSRGLDRFRDLRLDVDSMTYEELLELGEKIGHVNTGLGEDQIGSCLRKTKPPAVDEISSQFCIEEENEGQCSICQEEYEVEEEIGKLECGHAYHIHCIKQWLVRKNVCPVCKLEAFQ